MKSNPLTLKGHRTYIHLLISAEMASILCSRTGTTHDQIKFNKAVIIITDETVPLDVAENIKDEISSCAEEKDLNIRFLEEMPFSFKNTIGSYMDLFDSIAREYAAEFIVLLRQNDIKRMVIYIFDANDETMFIKEFKQFSHTGGKQYEKATKLNKSIKSKTESISDVALAEETTIKLCSYLTLIKDGGRIGIYKSFYTPSQDFMEKDKVPGPRAEIEKKDRILELTAGYGIDTISPEIPVIHSMVLALRIAPELTHNFSFELQYKLGSTVTVADSLVFAEIQKYPFTLNLRYRFNKGLFSMLPGMGITFELLRKIFHNISRIENTSVRDGQNSLDIIFISSIRFSFHLIPNLDFFIQPALNIYLKRWNWSYTYTKDGSENQKYLSTPYYSGFEVITGISVSLINPPVKAVKDKLNPNKMENYH